MKQRKSVITVMILSVFLCGLSSMSMAEQKAVRFGSVNWPGVTVKTEVVSQVVQALGYETEINQLQVPAIFKALSMGQLDVFMGCWLPTMDNYVKPYLAKEQIELLATNLSKTEYRNAVPAYVWDAGVTSLTDLDKPEYRDKFDRNGDGTPEIYGIEPGNDGNKLIIDAIESDTYGLGDWDMIPSSTAGMLSQVKKAAKDNEWIVFLGWEPHWMNLEWDLKYLDDPEKIWGEPGATHVDTATRAGLNKESPNLGAFLKQVVIQADWQSKWIMGYTYEGNEPEDVARVWIENNLDKVAAWLEGVTTRDGSQDGLSAVQKAFGQH